MPRAPSWFDHWSSHPRRTASSGARHTTSTRPPFSEAASNAGFRHSAVIWVVAQPASVATRLAASRREIGIRSIHLIGSPFDGRDSRGTKYPATGRDTANAAMLHGPKDADLHNPVQDVVDLGQPVWTAAERAAGRLFYASATCSTSLPKFRPLNSLFSASGNAATPPSTTSSRLFMRPSFR